MGVKVKRGLGLLVVAVLTLIASAVVERVAINGPNQGVFGAVLAVALVALVLVLLASFLGGLVLIAWGLLRD